MRIFILSIPFLLILIIYYLVKERNQAYKLYFQVTFALLVLEGLLIIYTYQLSSIFIKNSADFFIFLICLVFMIILVLVNANYLRTGGYKEFPLVKNGE